ncbi:fimbrial protein [Stenotrophomonas maltophilia]|uniref:fimbrial protein n=1 Tax=Stenotrophomonas maltophilia TaxID=40324 RepID=UPI0039C4DFD1
MKLQTMGWLVLLCSALPGVAAAQESTAFNLTGRILPGVCRIAASDVDLGTFYATDFTGVGTTKPWITTSIQVSNCDPLITRVALSFSGTADTANANYFRGVAGIGIEMERESPSTPVRPAGTTLQYATANGLYMVRARFRQTAATVAAGSVSSAVTVSMSYN